MTAGATEVEAVENLREAMMAWFESNLERDVPIPPPSPEPAHSGRLLLRLPRSLHRALAARAEADGVSINQMAVTLIALGLGAALNQARAANAERDDAPTAPSAAGDPGALMRALKTQLRPDPSFSESPR
jgi:hypothetical protein